MTTTPTNEIAPVSKLVPATRRRADERPALVYLARLADGSRRSMRESLDAVARLLSSGGCDAEAFDWSSLRYQHTAAVRAALLDTVSATTGKPLSVATVNKTLAALRGVLKETWRLGLLSAEDYQHAADIPTVKGETVPRGRALGSGEVRALFVACSADRTLAGARDSAMLGLLYGAGLRRSELVGLDREDYSEESGALTVRRGKGRKERIAYTTNGSADAMKAWLRVRGDDPGALFWPINKSGRAVSRRMSAHALLFVLRRRAKTAGVSQFSPHDLRRTFISDLLDAGADISTVQHLAGHASVGTTVRYDRRGEQAKQKAAALLHVPYVG
jgi:site-specific recombinase XerD